MAEGARVSQEDKWQQRPGKVRETEKEVWRTLAAVCLFSFVGSWGKEGRQKKEENTSVT